MTDKLFDVVFLDNAGKFLKSLDKKAASKIMFNLRKSQFSIDPALFKKLTANIWEFRTHHQGAQYRMLAFWDKTDKHNTLVIATHGFIKKQSKVPEFEIAKALNLKIKYFSDKKFNP
jgi:phage-related protein